METNLKPPRKKYDEAFKRSAVDLLLNGGKSVKQLAAELGVSTWNLRDWKKRYAPAPITNPRTPAGLEAENRALRQELVRVKAQRDILKKTLGILSTPGDSALNA
jgi:transposase-like protein